MHPDCEDDAPEQWRQVPDWEGVYEISDRGRLRSLHHSTPRVLSPSFHKNGYHDYQLWRGNARKRARAHVLVAAAFLGPRPPGMDVRHLDGNPDNNRLGNLAYGTRSQNLKDAVAHGHHRQANQTHCKRGHEFTPENTMRRPPNRRQCRACTRTWRERRAMVDNGQEAA